MKTKRRQELRTNELILHLLQIRDYAAQNWNRIAGALIVVVLVVLVIGYWQYSRVSRRTDGLNELAKVRESAGLSPAERLDKMEQVAKDYPDKLVVLQALETIGQMAMNQVLIGWTSDDPAQREKLLDRADQAFKRIVSEYPDRHQAVAGAHLQLAAIAEDRGNKEEAARQYKTILDSPQLAAITMYQSIAATRAKTLDERMKPVEILPSTRPASTQPTTMPTTTRVSTRPAPGMSVRPQMRLAPPTTRPAGAR
jgi:hypothetical protein